jgi:hypothetical protein
MNPMNKQYTSLCLRKTGGSERESATMWQDGNLDYLGLNLDARLVSKIQIDYHDP